MLICMNKYQNVPSDPDVPAVLDQDIFESGECPMSEEQKVVVREIPMEETTIFNRPMSSREVASLFEEIPPELAATGFDSWEELEGAMPEIRVESDGNPIPKWAR